ncbi:MAG TPA: YegS/Rv2252/BmrU family lipid kinase [Bacteroidia bacterium]|nr:YegS/Rv2252/BmrU family lipid kinase [Bacteroidia bacterium]
MEKRIAFVVNPNSGPRKKENIVDVIEKNMSGKTPFDILVWKDKNNFEEIRKQITSGKYTTVVAVGGDGTVNEVAKNLANTDIALGIIPRGSGNGLARSLGIPQNAAQAVKRVESGSVRTIDHGFINGKFFSCAAGVGFDAHICELFASSKTRGLLTYVRISLMQFLMYRAKEYTIQVNNETIKIKAFLIAFANTGQYGNDFYIAPQSKMDDGLLEIVILKPFNLLSAFDVFVKVLSRKANLSKSIVTLSGKRFILKNESSTTIHFDGEPGAVENEIEVSINPQSLKVVC